jgi:Flp pilus assembly protein TadG
MKRVPKAKRVQNNKRAQTMKRVRSGERGQALPLFILVMIALLAMVGLAIDAGRLYVARAELVRALDSAALAGVVELPDLPAAEQKASAYFDDNENLGTLSFPASQNESQFRVHGTRNVSFLFIRVLGFTDMDVKASAAAGFGTVPSDTVLEVDATGSMGASPCNGAQNNSGCPIWEAKQAALGFADLLMAGGSTITQIGYTPYRGCHNPPRTYSGCVTNSMRVDLTSSQASVNTAVNNTTAVGGSGTNTCLGLFKAQEMFNGPNAQTASNTVKSLVIMADGDNTYNVNSYSAAQGAPPVVCRPATNFTTSDADVGTACLGAQTRERSLDIKTKQLADTLKAQGVEIYIVAFGVCGTLNSSTPTTAYCNGIGNGDHDNTADQRLLKCIASSTPGTNDHYYQVPTASDLPEVFQTIAQTIAFRLIE